jgi:hypothetical protein
MVRSTWGPNFKLEVRASRFVAAAERMTGWIGAPAVGTEYGVRNTIIQVSVLRAMLFDGVRSNYLQPLFGSPQSRCSVHLATLLGRGGRGTEYNNEVRAERKASAPYLTEYRYNRYVARKPGGQHTPFIKHALGVILKDPVSDRYLALRSARRRGYGVMTTDSSFMLDYGSTILRTLH